MPAFLSFEDYQAWVETTYGANIQDCDKERIMPAMDLVYVFAMSKFNPRNCGCSGYGEIPQYLIDAIYKGTYHFKEVETDETAQDRWQEMVFNELRSNNGIVLDNEN